MRRGLRASIGGWRGEGNLRACMFISFPFAFLPLLTPAPTRCHFSVILESRRRDCQTRRAVGQELDGELGGSHEGTALCALRAQEVERRGFSLYVDFSCFFSFR